MTTPQWLQLIATIVAVAVGYGVLSQKVNQLGTEVRELKAGLQRQGERLGKAETAIEIAKAIERRFTRAGGVPTPVEDVGSEPR